MDIDTIPPGCEPEFVGEGAANVVFAIKPPSTSPSHSSFQGKLLRVPKAGTRAYPHPELQEYWETAVKPLFGRDDLVQQSLVRLTGSGIVSKLNTLLSEDETSRRDDFRGGRVADAEFGMLVEDMRKLQPGDSVFEFKPKWLAQSPSAPPAARRCRNCAREALRNHVHGTSVPIPCPLDLLQCSGDAAARRRVLNGIVGDDGPAISEPQLDRVVDWLRTNGLIERLRSAQVRNDPNGPLKGTADDPRLQLAMTLRDCTCFIRIPADAGESVQAKLGDLDKKNGEAKFSYWQSMERKLANGGYYEGKEVPVQKTACELERQR